MECDKGDYAWSAKTWISYLTFYNQKRVKKKCIILFIKKCVYNMWNVGFKKKKKHIASAASLSFVSDNKIHLLWIINF